MFPLALGMQASELGVEIPTSSYVWICRRNVRDELQRAVDRDKDFWASWHTNICAGSLTNVYAAWCMKFRAGLHIELWAGRHIEVWARRRTSRRRRGVKVGADG